MSAIPESHPIMATVPEALPKMAAQCSKCTFLLGSTGAPNFKKLGHKQKFRSTHQKFMSTTTTNDILTDFFYLKTTPINTNKIMNEMY